MKYLVLLLLSTFIVGVHRHARSKFVAAYIVALYVLSCSMFVGCATVEPPSPGPAPTGDLCSHDGTYELINCKRYFP